MTSSNRHTNRLAKETSPYLLQHAHNPVDWYPWGSEAFEAARTQDKPIFLSVGYSTCYWCHVMERECFENESIAAEMNRLFINIKVDREERPDVDQLYMTAVQVLTHHGGWPMSTFLLPDLRPFYGGTYFPPVDSHGRPGFVTLIRALEDAYRNRRDEVQRSAAQLGGILQQLALPERPKHPVVVDWPLIDEIVQRSAADYDAVHGGFGGAPKFPRQTLLEMLLTYLKARPASEDTKSAIMNMLRHSLDAMMYGGIRDQLGGGFHRYSTDAEWLVPHFEIMLYDNAMLAVVYAEAFALTGDKRYARTCREMLDFTLRELTSPDGAFYTALDAEVDSKEGGSYLWTADEIRASAEPAKGMGAEFSEDDAKLFAKVFGLDAGPNFADPHHGSGAPDANVLFVAEPDLFERHHEILRRMCDRLYDVRRRRKQPALDTKILTSWNALMIRAMARAGSVLNELKYRDAARRAAGYLLSRHVVDGRLVRTSRDGIAKHEACLDDYAFFIQALLEIDPNDSDARRLASEMRQRFAAPDGGFFFTAESTSDLFVRQMSAHDSPLPSGNGVAALVSLALDDPAPVKGTLAAFAYPLERQPESMGSLAQAAIEYVARVGRFTVEPVKQQRSERPESPETLARRVVGVGTSWRDATILEIALQIMKPYHIQANQAGAGLIATTVTVDRVHAAKISYPKGRDAQFAFASEPIGVYDGTATISVSFERPVNRPVKLRIEYQACDDAACLPKVVREIEVDAPV